MLTPLQFGMAVHRRYPLKQKNHWLFGRPWRFYVNDAQDLSKRHYYFVTGMDKFLLWRKGQKFIHEAGFVQGKHPFVYPPPPKASAQERFSYVRLDDFVRAQNAYDALEPVLKKLAGKAKD